MIIYLVTKAKKRLIKNRIFREQKGFLTIRNEIVEV